MLSRVADSLYWMSRYFERAVTSARVLDATWNLMLNPSKTATEERWRRALVALGLPKEAEKLDAQDAIMQLAVDSSNSSSIVSSITAARENASQVREEISSGMWEHLNRLYHDVLRASSDADPFAGPTTVIDLLREGSYRFKGITDGTMNHGEGYHFIQLGKYSERACALSLLLDAYYSTKSKATDLDWIALLTSCSAFEAYCKVYTADLRPERVAEFILLHPEFPYSVRYSADQMRSALEAIADRSPARKADRVERLVGRLSASLAYVQIDEVMAGDLHTYLIGVVEQCGNLHASLHEAYIEYPIEEALEV
jgi:uncharacterized alpha-E superfamily protein